MTKKSKAITFRNHLLPIDVVQFEAHSFDAVLEVTPQDILQSLVSAREEIESQFLIQIFGDYLGIGIRLEESLFTIPQHRHLIVALTSHLPHERTVAIWNIGDLKFGAGEFEDATLDDAEWAPRKLNQFQHSRATTRAY